MTGWTSIATRPPSDKAVEFRLIDGVLWWRVITP